MNSIFLLWYLHAKDTDNESEVLIGAYSTEAAAKAAINRLSGKPRFSAAPNGFQISEYKLNEDHWTDGFVVDKS
ncbi:MAG TPA: hypothetical protein VNK23_01190 [Candidatus Dormibacteraeota bacterium]|nr:hypothetical protein [Candidatus Dormibacteraeota bacterium]